MKTENLQRTDAATSIMLSEFFLPPECGEMKRERKDTVSTDICSNLTEWYEVTDNNKKEEIIQKKTCPSMKKNWWFKGESNLQHMLSGKWGTGVWIMMSLFDTAGNKMEALAVNFS